MLLVKPNSRLAQAYISKAEEAAVTLREVTSKEWKIATAYYAMYFSIYAVLS